MKVANVVACFLVAFDCGEKAVGRVEQHLFPPDLIWLWYIAAAMWLYVCFKNIKATYD